jgi:hypothetical protein
VILFLPVSQYCRLPAVGFGYMHIMFECTNLLLLLLRASLADTYFGILGGKDDRSRDREYSTPDEFAWDVNYSTTEQLEIDPAQNRSVVFNSTHNNRLFIHDVFIPSN